MRPDFGLSQSSVCVHVWVRVYLCAGLCFRSGKKEKRCCRKCRCRSARKLMRLKRGGWLDCGSQLTAHLTAVTTGDELATLSFVFPIPPDGCSRCLSLELPPVFLSAVTKCLLTRNHLTWSLYYRVFTLQHKASRGDYIKKIELNWIDFDNYKCIVVEKGGVCHWV